MPSNKDNIKELFVNSRTRLIIFITVVMIIVAMIIGFLQFQSGTSIEMGASVLRGVPSIESIPGSVTPTEQYAELQQKENLQKVEAAKQTGGSAIPTLIRIEKFAEGQTPLATGDAGVGFSTLSLAREGGGVRAWLNDLKNSSCAPNEVKYAVGQGASLEDLKTACSCLQLKAQGFELDQLSVGCDCTELKVAGFSAKDLKEVGFSARRLRICGFSACSMKAAGFNAEELKGAGFADGELKGAGFSGEEIQQAAGLPGDVTEEEVRNAGCRIAALKKLRERGVSAAVIRRISGCSAAQLRAAGYSAEELRNAGFSAGELKGAGFSDNEVLATGLKLDKSEGMPKNCSVEELKTARANGISARTIKEQLGCSARQLKAAGYTAKELLEAGFTAAELRNAGFNIRELREAGFSAEELRSSGFSSQELKDAGFSARELMAAGFSAADLKDAGFSPESLANAGFSADELLDAGFNREQLKKAGFRDKDLGIVQPVAPAAKAAVATVDDSEINPLVKDPDVRKALALQRLKQDRAKYEQQLQEIQSEMMAQAQMITSGWAPVEQEYVEGDESDKDKGPQGGAASGQKGDTGVDTAAPSMIKAGDILFAVLETEINSDEPSPILARIVQGPLKGARLMGTVTLPPQGQRVILQFNKMSIPGAPKTIGIEAVAIDLNTARTAVSSRTENHYLTRYGALLASSFLEGIGEAVSTQGTTVTFSGLNVSTGQPSRALGETLVSSLGKVGANWGEAIKPNVNRPPTVHVYSGTGLGLLFMSDVKAINK